MLLLWLGPLFGKDGDRSESTLSTIIHHAKNVIRGKNPDHKYFGPYNNDQARQLEPHGKTSSPHTPQQV